MRRKVLSIVLALAMVATSMNFALLTANADVGHWTDTGKYDTSWYDASKSEFNISTAAELAGLAYLNNEGTDFTGKTIILGNSIDLKDYYWVPIGLSCYPTYCDFKGTFDGNGNKIIGLKVESNYYNDAGLFGSIGSGAVIKNLIVDGIVENNLVYSSSSILVGKNGGTVVNCGVSGNISNEGDSSYAGGIVGYNYEGAVINCYSNVNITLAENIVSPGGLIGATYLGDVANCYSTATFSGGTNGGVFYGSGYFNSEANNNCFYNKDNGNAIWDSNNYNLVPTALCEKQIIAESGTDNAEWEKIYGDNTKRIALVDSLSAYVDNKKTYNGIDLYRWANDDETGMPVFNPVCTIENKGHETTYASIESALKAVEDGTPTTISLINDDNENVNIPNGKSIILDLNGHNLYAKKDNVITNNGSLILKDSSEKGKGGIVKGTDGIIGVNQNGTFTLSGKVNVINIYLHDGKTIDVDSSFVGTATVDTEKEPTSGIPVRISGSNSVDLSKSITSNNPKYLVEDSIESENHYLYIGLIEGHWTDTGNYDTSWYDASKSEFRISTAAELAGLAYLNNCTNENERVDFTGKTIILGNSIDLKDYYWVPIGQTAHPFDCPFKGTFDGNGYEIKGLNVEINNYNDSGLFGAIDSVAVVKNLIVSGTVSNNLAASSASILVGCNSGGTVVNCGVSGNVCNDGNNSYAGGIIGYNDGGATINCYSLVNISFTEQSVCAGGLIAATVSGSVANCFSSATFSGGTYGGVFYGSGNFASGENKNCFYNMNNGNAVWVSANCNLKPTALSVRQVKAESGTANAAWVKIYGDDTKNIALVDSLSAYVSDNPMYGNQDLYSWVNAYEGEKSFPVILLKRVKVTIGEKSYEVAYNSLLKKTDEPSKDGYVFGGWFTDEKCTNAWNFENDRVTQDITLYAKWIEQDVDKAKISGSVKVGSSPVANAVVELRLGTSKVAATKTDGNGKYSFGNVENGKYNIVVAYEGKEKTELVSVNEPGNFAAPDIVLSEKAVSSKVEFEGSSVADSKSDVTKSTVGGVDKIAESFTPENSETITITLKVESKAEDSENPGQNAIKIMAGEQTLEFIDLTLLKQVDDGLPEDIGGANNTLLTINVPFDTNGVDVESIAVYRYHDSEANKFIRITSEADKSDGTFMLKDGYITIFAEKFSEYGIGYSLIKDKSCGILAAILSVLKTYTGWKIVKSLTSGLIKPVLNFWNDYFKMFPLWNRFFYSFLK